MSLFVGPSYPLAAGRVSPQRTVNMHLVPMETEGKSQFYLQSVPGLVLQDNLGGPCRGAYVAGSRLFAVFGELLYELDENDGATNLGTLATSEGEAGMVHGLTQLVIVDGEHGYTFNLSTDAFAQITDADFPGADAVGYIGGFFTFTERETQQAYVSAIDDATSIDALDYASAESKPDNIVTHRISHREAVYFGEDGIDRWFLSGGEYPLSQDAAATSDIGCMAAGSVRELDNSLFWVGRDANGSGMVYRDVDRQPRRVSNRAVEEALRQSSDLSAAVAYTYQRDGLSFYCLNAPGVPATWCYEVSTGAWHERCDLDSYGQFCAHRVTHMAHFRGVHYAFDADGNWYRVDDQVYTFNGDPIKRTRISPGNVQPLRARQRFNQFVLDCTTGECEQDDEPVVELSWSNDGGKTWSDPVSRPYGPVGAYHPRLVWHRVGTARDRVWRVDFDGNAPWAIVSGEAA